MEPSQETTAQLPQDDRRGSDHKEKENGEKEPLLGPNSGFKSKRSICSGAGHFSIFVLIACVAVSVIYAVHRFRQRNSLAQKGPDLVHAADVQRQHLRTPAVPTQTPGQASWHPLHSQVGHRIWPQRAAGPVTHGPVWTGYHPEQMPKPAAELTSGTLNAHILGLEEHVPSWHTLGDPSSILLGAASRPLFSLLPASHDGQMITSKECKTMGHDQSKQRILLRLSCPSNVEANFEIRTPANAEGYLRFSVELWTKRGIWPPELATLRLLDVSIPADTLVTSTGPANEPGLPVVIGGKLFVGGEHPMAITGSHASSPGVFIDIRHLQSLPQPTAAKPWTFGAVIGSIPEVSQARRAFINYLHNERPGRRTPMVHYNSWFDFYGWQDEGFFHDRADRADIMNETSCIQRVDAFGQHLVKEHGVQVDSFLIDDGWDNTQTLWEFDKDRFPRGFERVAEKAETYGSGIGVWLSPWGGYGDSKKNRVRAGQKIGLETHIDPWGEEALDLAGPKYRDWFVKAATHMRHDQGVNLFKFDGVGRAPREMGAMLGMLADVRNMKVARHATQRDEDKMWISLTTGTWPSPFFLLWADNIWRGDGDVGPRPGKEPNDGLSQRQKWIRWRAEKVQQHIVKQSAFFPLSQLMIHGVVLAGHGDALDAGLGSATDIDFGQEVWSFLGLGLQLQELYISPKRMTPSFWAILAEGLAWARVNAKILLDSHWAFGDVAKRQVFCTAAWDNLAGHGFVLIQNPSSSTQNSQQFSLDAVLELPNAQAGSLLEVSVVKAIAGLEEHTPAADISQRLQECQHSTSRFASKAACHIKADVQTTISLKHTEVILLEVRSLAPEPVAR